MGENNVPSVESLIGAVAARHGILLKPSDAAFALVTINEMLLERSARQIAEQMDRRLKDFDASVQRVEQRAGRLLAQEVKDAAGKIREELQRDIDVARINAAELVRRVEVAHSRGALVRWGAMGVICGMILFGAGLWCGLHHLF